MGNSTYGMVYWTQMDTVPLPDDIVQRFANKTIAITGYEMDQVLHDGSSVPINWAYNHHYVAWIKGRDSELTLVPAHPSEHSYWMRGDGRKYVLRKKDNITSDSEIPTGQIFAEGNGGESRKSFHGYPSGVAQLVASPVSFVINPMQIDTWNRDKMKKPSDPFVPGPESKAAQSPPNADYSGHLECPCTDRLYKEINSTYATQNAGTCIGGNAGRVWNASKCFEGVADLFGRKPAKTNVIDD